MYEILYKRRWSSVFKLGANSSSYVPSLPDIPYPWSIWILSSNPQNIHSRSSRMLRIHHLEVAWAQWSSVVQISIAIWSAISPQEQSSPQIGIWWIDIRGWHLQVALPGRCWWGRRAWPQWSAGPVQRFVHQPFCGSCAPIRIEKVRGPMQS